MEPIAFNRPHLTGRELELLSDALERRHLSGDGHYTKAASALLQEITGATRVLLTTSCTHALEMSALLCDLQPGDEVIMPSYTFVSTANAFVLRGATPVFVDIRRDTLNIDERLIEQAITPRTRAIVVVHYAGIACEMDEIMAIAGRHSLTLIEDAAHALGATYRGRQLGTMGELGTLSFHATKNIVSGEGGALLINDERLFGRAETIREKGTNRSQFFRGEVDKYTWVDIGSSYLPSELVCAVLTAQLESFDAIQSRRLGIWRRYRSGLAEWAQGQGVRLPPDHDDRKHPGHLFALVFPDLEHRLRFMQHMSGAGIATPFQYVPLHTAPASERWCPPPSLPETDRAAAGLVRLPLYPDLTDAEVDRVIETAITFTYAAG